jgi:dTDP-4-amino-4,6-dideoxygalactose transaminase
MGVKHLFFVSNGTIALQIAIKALDLHGEIITTPFSYVATTSSIIWEGCTPVFVDIDSETLCINPDLIENAITPRTTAILATHIYGYCCDVEEIQLIAKRHKLKVIYDAAHAFGVKYKGNSLVQYGDISTLSFHGTKIFHTCEGGAIATNDDEVAHRIAYMRNFGHKNQEELWGLGINGKNSEFHAAMGLCILPRIAEIIASNHVISDLYDDLLKGSLLTRPVLAPKTDYNYAYYAVLFESQKALLKVNTVLNDNKIFPRRYFYPALNTLPYIHPISMPVTDDISKRVLCLPLSLELTTEEIELVCGLILKNLK